MDARAETPWTEQALAAIGRHPGVRAGDLAADFDWDTPTFKRQIRKLKALGLTHSLERGYELSARGRQLLARMR
jgi:DNA-binding MarR family transcriptional regulator